MSLSDCFVSLFGQHLRELFSEIAKLLTEIKDLKATLVETQRTVELKENEIKKAQELVSLC